MVKKNLSSLPDPSYKWLLPNIPIIMLVYSVHKLQKCHITIKCNNTSTRIYSGLYSITATPHPSAFYILECVLYGLQNLSYISQGQGGGVWNIISFFFYLVSNDRGQRAEVKGHARSKVMSRGGQSTTTHVNCFPVRGWSITVPVQGHPRSRSSKVKVIECHPRPR